MPETAGGLLLPHLVAFHMNVPRLERALIRYVRGLHRFELGTRLADDCAVRPVVKPDVIHLFRSAVERVMTGRRQVIVQSEVFWYQYGLTKDRGSVWLLMFFDAFPMLAIVYPPGKAPADLPQSHRGSLVLPCEPDVFATVN